MKQYVIGSALAVLALSATACAQQDAAPAPQAIVVKHHTPTHEIPTINTDRGDTDAKVNYVTGGIGDDERAAIEAEKASYNVHITSSAKNGAFVEDTAISIKDKAGNELLGLSAGPLLYVQLPAGTYTVEATHGDQQVTRKLVVGKKATARLHFGWTVASNVSE